MPNKDSKRLPIQKRTSAQVLVLGRLALNPFLDFCRECWALEQCTVLGRNVCPVKILVNPQARARMIRNVSYLTSSLEPSTVLAPTTPQSAT
jgi:hypothetical protein